MSKRLTQFESILKEKMADHEVPYDIKSWYGIEKHMAHRTKSNSPWIVALAATCFVSGAIAYSLYNYKYNGSAALLVNNSSKRFEQTSIDNIRASSSSMVQNYAQLFEEDTPAFLPQPSASSKSGNNRTSVANPSIEHRLETEQLHDRGNNQSSEVILSSKNVLAFESNIRQGCAGDEIEFKATNGPSSGSYLWNFGDGRFSNDANPKHKFSKPGKYDVSLSVTSNDGQIRTVVMNDMITIFPTPDANFGWNFIADTPENVAIQIVNTSSNANEYEWKFADGTVTQQVNPVKPVHSGKESVVLFVSNEYGCKDEVIKQISVNTDMNFGASNTFYPEKEAFMPSELKLKDLNFILTIYDKNNNQIYQTTNASKGWDGKLQDGATARGEHKWTAVVTNTRGEQKFLSGTFNVFP
jgi:PKD repeat protein